MTKTRFLNRSIGETERTLGALLGQVLHPIGLTFPEWTVLSVLNGSGPQSVEWVVDQLIDGQIAASGDARDVVAGLQAKGLLAPVAGVLVSSGLEGDGESVQLTLTEAGESRYQPVRRTVASITTDLYSGLPEDDLETTQRILAEVSRRGKRRLGTIA